MPPLIGGVTLAVRRWGAGWGGWIGGFPWVAGPISFFITLEHGAAFSSSTIPAAMMGSVGTTLFVFCYACLASKLSWLPTVLLSYLTFMVVAMVSLHVQPSLPFAALLNIGVLSAVLYFFPKPGEKEKNTRQPPYDIPLRMIVATGFVIVVTKASQELGSSWSGLLTPFPIMTSTLAVFTHAQQGSDSTSRILYGMLLTGYGFVFFLLGVAWLVPQLSIYWSYFLLVLGTMSINAFTTRLIR